MYKVLIVDDEPLMRQALKIMISKVEGFEVLYTVGSGEESIEICKNNKIDIVFMDIMMPGISGIEASKMIYKNDYKTTIYILSSYNSFDFAVEALKSKVKEYISKPVTFNQVKNILDIYKIENDTKKIDSENSYSNEFKALFSIIKNKDFRNAYYDISKITDSIYNNSLYNGENIKEKFLEIGQKLLDVSRLFEENPIEINKIFPVDEILSDDKRYYEFWLYKIINYIFRENSIKKYSLLRNVFEYIECHIEDEIGLNEIINNCSLSQGYLSRIFKSQFNVSVMEYIHMRKINRAKSYLCFSELSITDVAFKLGYNESSYFSKVFKKYENITVYQYKKML